MPNRFFHRALVASLPALVALIPGCSDRSPTGPSQSTNPTIVAGHIVLTPAGAVVGTSVSFASQGASDAGGNPLTFTWDFGDGGTATGATTTHAYPTAGDFITKVTVRDATGKSATATSAVTVKNLTAHWFGDPLGLHPLFGGHTAVTIAQNGLDLTGTYRDDSYNGSIAGTISATGTVTFTVTIPGLIPFTFTGTAGAAVNALEGVANESGFVNQAWTLRRG